MACNTFTEGSSNLTSICRLRLIRSLITPPLPLTISSFLPGLRVVLALIRAGRSSQPSSSRPRICRQMVSWSRRYSGENSQIRIFGGFFWNSSLPRYWIIDPSRPPPGKATLSTSAPMYCSRKPEKL
ncbi:hypothetical protein D9M68_846980 [compost metagenome]